MLRPFHTHLDELVITFPHLSLACNCAGVILPPLSERHATMNRHSGRRDAAVAPLPVSVQQHLAAVMLLQLWMIHMRR